MAISDALKKQVAARANSCCEYCLCQEKYSPATFSIDHIIPLSKDGNDDIENLAYACQGCNNFKYNHLSGFDSITGQNVPLFNPRTQDWKEHFMWNKDYSLMVGKTPIGRATIERLKLNRPSIANLRGALHILGIHPPLLK
ncbi:MAG: HNH endonuclease [Lewinellaceae bacterium]|nr:HNH endonuclease [Lewinellaceae bacterium]